MNIATTKFGYSKYSDLQIGDEFSAAASLDKTNCSYLIDLKVQDLVDSLVCEYSDFELNETDIKVIKVLESSFDDLSFDFLAGFYILQNLISKKFEAGTVISRALMAASSSSLKMSEILLSNNAMCSEFSVLACLLLSRLGLSSSIIMAKTSFGSKSIEDHAMVYTSKVVWDVMNPLKLPQISVTFPSLYVSKDLDMKIQNLYQKFGAELTISRMPNHKSPKMASNLILKTY